MWTLLAVVFGAAIQARWRAERLKTEISDRDARDAGYALAVERAADRYDRAVTAWMQTIPPIYNRDSPERDEVASAASALRRLREIRRQEEAEDGLHPR